MTFGTRPVPDPPQSSLTVTTGFFGAGSGTGTPPEHVHGTDARVAFLGRFLASGCAGNSLLGCLIGWGFPVFTGGQQKILSFGLFLPTGGYRDLC